MLPPGWQEVNNGAQVYYHNATTGETTWTRPGTGSPMAPVVPRPMAIGMSGDALPAGWDAVPSAQGTYYLNRTTGETTWTKPTGAAPLPAASSLSTPPALAYVPQPSDATVKNTAMVAAVAAQARQEAQAAAEAAAREAAFSDQATQAASHASHDAETARERRDQWTKHSELCAQVAVEAKQAEEAAEAVKQTAVAEAAEARTALSRADAVLARASSAVTAAKIEWASLEKAAEEEGRKATELRAHAEALRRTAALRAEEAAAAAEIASQWHRAKKEDEAMASQVPLIGLDCP